MRIYFYKMTTDNGGAPAIQDGLLSLAICKPRIRSTCKEGDLIFGFGSKTRDKHHHLIYVAHITEKMAGCRYYDTKTYANRPDSIYAKNAQGLYVRKPSSKYHSDGALMESDIGLPDRYENANVLLSKQFRYFGRYSLEIHKMNGAKHIFETLRYALDELKQGHRVNHASNVKEELKLLCELAFKYPLENNPPTDSDTTGSCTETDGDCVGRISNTILDCVP